MKIYDVFDFIITVQLEEKNVKEHYMKVEKQHTVVLDHVAMNAKRSSECHSVNGSKSYNQI